MTSVLNIPADLAQEGPPSDWPWKSGCWLVARSPMLAHLVARIPGAVDSGGDPDFAVIAEAINYHDQGESGVSEDTDLDAAGGAADAYVPMSSGEKQMLRALAVLAGRTPVLWSASGAFSSVSDRSFVADWCEAVAAS